MKANVDKSDETTSLRHKAEEILKSKLLRQNVRLSDIDTFKLIHELEVHQIELEMQNEELEKAKAQAEQAKEKYLDLYDFAPSGYFTLAKDGEIIELNLHGSQILGKERSFLKQCHLGFFIAPYSKPIFNQFLENIFHSTNKETCELTLLTKDNAPIYVYLSGVAIENGTQCLVVMVDITERKQEEIELIKAKERAEESDRLKTAFIQNVSHEIRTPMNAIMGFSALLVEHYNDRPKIEGYSRIINQRCNDLLDIINDILDISKIESSQLTVTFDKCNLKALFAELTAFFIQYQNRLNKQHILLTLEAHCDPSDTIFITDSVKLKQIFINLISNAIKFTNEGSVDGGCRYDANHNLVFYVSDTGMGIPHDKQKTVFERFAQLKQKSSQTFGGTGLGLSIVKGLVELLGGDIILVSEPEQGSTFSFVLPYITMDSLPNHPIVVNNDETFSFYNTSILVVEDDPCNAEFLIAILSEAGLTTTHAKCGKDAVHLALTQPFDLALMDIRLPDMDGYEIISQIKILRPDLKIIAQTAYASADEKQKAMNAGFCDFISKPFDRKHLLALINKQLV